MKEQVPIKEEAKVPPMFLGLQWGFLGEWLLLVLNRIATNNGWHTMPFKDTPNAPTLACECR
jgi:hypothetical protein